MQKKCIYLVTTVCLALPRGLQAAADGCPQLSEAESSRLAEYAHTKLKLPASVVLRIGESELVESSCFRKLRFRAQGSGAAHEYVLFLSPDRRFLSRDLFDTAVDPTEELRRQESLLSAELAGDDFPSEGPVDSHVTLTLFSDFQCPYCKREFDVLKAVTAGRADLRVVFRNLPLPMHPWARQAAEAAECSYRQNNSAFWRVHDFLFTHQDEIASGNVLAKIKDVLGTAPGVNLETYEKCITDHAMEGRIQMDMSFANDHGITATPTLFINGKSRVGVVGEDELRSLIAAAEKSASKSDRDTTSPVR